MKTVFLDTSGIVAAINSRDAYHEKARQIFYKLAEEKTILLITNYIRAETHALLLHRAGRKSALKAGRKSALNFLEDHSWLVEWVLPDDEKNAVSLLYEYGDKDFSLTDATSFVVMKRLGIKEAVFFDRHFRQFGIRLPYFD